MKFIFTGKEWLFLLIAGPVIVFLLAMIDIPLVYWLPAIDFLPEWMHYYSVLDLVKMSWVTILVGIMLSFFLIVLDKIRRS